LSFKAQSYIDLAFQALAEADPHHRIMDNQGELLALQLLEFGIPMLKLLCMPLSSLVWEEVAQGVLCAYI